MNGVKKEEQPRESAGRLMSVNIPKVNFKKTIGDAEKILLKNNFDFIDYIYIIDDKEKLVGIISAKDIFKFKKNSPLKKIMNREVISVRANTDQERVALLALKNNLKSIPVVDKENKLLGAISAHTIFRILHSEGIEDVLRSAGIRKFKDPAIDIINASATTHFKKRLPWLVLGLIGGILAAIIVNHFENLLDLYIILAAFIPAVVYMSDAVGSQAQTIFIRSMALDKELNLKFYSLRELKTNFFLGLVLGAIFFVVVLIGWKMPFFGFVIGISIFFTVLISMGISILLPIIFSKFNFDPAISSGPFATAVRDLSSLLVYFAISTILIAVI